MKPINLTVGRQLRGTFSYELERLSKNDQGKCISVFIQENSHDILIKVRDGESCVVSAVDQNARNLLEEVRKAGSACVCWIVSVYPQQSRLMIQAHIFPLEVLCFPAESPLTIILTDSFIEKNNKLVEDFKHEFLLEDMLFGMLYPSGSDVAIRLIGSKKTCDIRIDSQGFLYADALGWKPRRLNSAVTLFRGTIQFVELPFAKNSPLFVHQLSQYTQKIGHYLDLWEVYNFLEKEFKEEEIGEIGYVMYDKYEKIRLDDEIVFRFYCAEKIPALFDSERFNIDAVALDDLDEKSERIRVKEFDYIGEKKDIDWGQRCIDISIDINSWLSSHKRGTNQEFPSPGYLIPSIFGDEVRFKRRERAVEKIRQYRNPLASLYSMLEQGAAPVVERNDDTPLSDAVLQVFGEDSPPTESQREALKMALNTPDIALIQGPPGTGKTTVIRALVTRLLELGRKERVDPISILISSYQHDAVDNALEKLHLLDVPPNRIGGRRGKRECEVLPIVKTKIGKL